MFKVLILLLIILNCNKNLNVLAQLNKKIIDDLIEAIVENNLQEVRKIILITDININLKDSYNNLTPLTACNYFDNLEAFKLLIDIKEGIDANILDPNGYSPLMYIAKKNNVELAKLLMKKGIKIDLLSSSEETALILAIKYTSFEMIELLIKEGANVNYTNKMDATPLMLAVYKRDVNTVKLLLENGANVNASDRGANFLPSSDSNKVLAYVLKNPYEVKSCLWSSPYNPNNSFEIPSSTEIENIEIIKLLIEKGVDINNVDDKNSSALMVACEQLHLEAIELLIDRKRS